LNPRPSDYKFENGTNQPQNTSKSGGVCNSIGSIRPINPEFQYKTGTRRLLWQIGRAQSTAIALPPRVQAIVNEAEDAHGVPRGSILSGSRVRPASRARRMACWNLRVAGHALQQIGHWLNLDHTSVMYQLEQARPRKAA
jgi:hypothetical protein